MIRSSSANHIELELTATEKRQFFRILRDLEINPEGVVMISVTIVRQGLTDEICIEKFLNTQSPSENNAQRDLLDGFEP